MEGFFGLGALSGRLVRLEPLEARHVVGIAEAAGRGRERYVFTTVPQGVDEAAEYVGRLIEQRERREAIGFAVVDPRDGRVVGSTRFLRFEYWKWKDRVRTTPDAVELGGSFLSLETQRTGMNREAKLLMLGAAFDRGGVFRVRLRTDARNVRARVAIEAIGAKLDGIVRYDEAGHDHGIRDSAYYSILQEEWPDVRARIEASLQREAR